MTEINESGGLHQRKTDKRTETLRHDEAGGDTTPKKSRRTTQQQQQKKKTPKKHKLKKRKDLNKSKALKDSNREVNTDHDTPRKPPQSQVAKMKEDLHILQSILRTTDNPMSMQEMEAIANARNLKPVEKKLFSLKTQLDMCLLLTIFGSALVYIHFFMGVNLWYVFFGWIKTRS